MTPKQRIQRALAHQETDFCPYDLGFDAGLRERLVAFTGDPNFDQGLVPHLASVGIGYPETHERVDDHHYTDAFGVIWEDSFPGEIGMVRDPILKQPTLVGYEFPPTQVPDLFHSMGEQIAQHPDRYLSWGIGFSLYERAWTLRGIEPFLLDMIERPRFADELLDRICEFNLALIDQACVYPFDSVRFGDDWGSQRGLIMGPKLWRRFVKPRFARMVQRALSYGKTTFLHSDGDVSEIIPDLIEIGLTVLNPVQPDVMDIYQIKREYGRDIAFHGGVSVQHLLPDSTPEELRQELRHLIREVGAGGGFIIAPTHSLGSDIPLENLVVLVEELTRQTARQGGRYGPARS
jgi:uroporphyrinogen decarboxylase